MEPLARRVALALHRLADRISAPEPRRVGVVIGPPRCAWDTPESAQARDAIIQGRVDHGPAFYSTDKYSELAAKCSDAIRDHTANWAAREAERRLP